jgi:hypothetical protein
MRARPLLSTRILFAVAALGAPGVAFAHGPLAMVGAVITPTKDSEGVHFTPLVGPTVRAGWEFGGRWNHEVAFQLTRADGIAESGGFDFQTGLTTYALGYRFAVDILDKKGFTPYVGLGMYLGVVQIEVEDATTVTGVDDTRPYLELDAAVGARYCFDWGLNIRADVVFSTYGGFLAFQPGVGAGYQF